MFKKYLFSMLLVVLGACSYQVPEASVPTLKGSIALYAGTKRISFYQFTDCTFFEGGVRFTTSELHQVITWNGSYAINWYSDNLP